MPAPLDKAAAGPSPETNSAQTPAKIVSFPTRAIIIIVILLLILFLVLFLIYKSQVAARVGSETISGASVNKFSKDCSLSKKDAVYYLVDEKVLTKWAQDEKITVAQSEADQEAVRIGGRSPKDCKKTEARVNLLREKLSDNLVKFREGELLVVNFDRFIPSPFVRTDLTQAELAKLSKDERAYADVLVKSLYADISSKKLTFEQALEKVKEDPKVGAKSAYATAVSGGPFTSRDYINKRGLLADETIRSKVDNLAAQSVSEPFVMQFNLNADRSGAAPKLVDVRWVIAKVERVGKGFSQTADQLLNQTRDQYKAKVYLK